MTRFSTKRTLAMVVAITMILCLVPIVSMAASISNLSIDYDDVEDKYVVSGTTSEFSSGGQVTMLVIYADGELEEIPTELDENYIMYIDQKDPDGNGSFSWEFTKRDTAEERSHMTVFAGGSDVDTVGYASYEMPEDLLDGPVVEYDEECLLGDDIVISYDTTEFADWADIISITLNGEDLTDFILDKAAGTITIPTDEDILHNIVISAEGYEGVVVSVNVTLRPAGVVALGDYEPTLQCFIEGTTDFDAVFSIEDTNPTGWLGAVTISVVDGEGNDAGTVDVDTGVGTISITDGAPDTKTTYTLQFRAEGYADKDVSFSIISKYGATDARLNKTVTVDWAEKPGTAVTDTDNYYITVPADGTDTITGLPYVYKVYDGDQEVSYDIDAEAYKISRKPAGEGSKTAYVKAIIDGDTVNPVIISEITVAEIGASGGVSISEDDVTIIGENVYATVLGEDNGKSVVIINNSSAINATSKSIQINSTPLYYNPALNIFVGVITKDTKANIASAASIVDTPSETFGYGNCRPDPTTGYSIQTSDYGSCRRVAARLDRALSETLTIKQVIAMDVANGAMDGTINTADYGAVRRVAARLDAGLAINAK